MTEDETPVTPVIDTVSVVTLLDDDNFDSPIVLPAPATPTPFVTPVNDAASVVDPVTPDDYVAPTVLPATPTRELTEEDIITGDTLPLFAACLTHTFAIGAIAGLLMF